MKIWPAPALGLLSALFAFSSFADEVNGTLGVKLIITNGCAVNGRGVTASSPDMGLLDFGSTATLSQSLDGEAISTTAGALQIQCTSALPYSILIGAGSHDLDDQRRMAKGSEYISYNLYQDTGRNTQWSKTGTVSRTATGAQENLAIYGRVPPQDVPSAGTYTDTVQVTVSW